MTVLDAHRMLLADRLGQEAYRQAIHRAVHPGAVVLDLGTGTGVHALFACRAGASRVYAVDRDIVIELARSMARANGFDNRITFIHADAETVTLPEPVDVIVAHHVIEDLLDLLPAARRRFLKPGGVVIPASAEFFAAAAEAPGAYEQMVAFWGERLGLDFTPVREVAANTVHGWRLEPGEVLSEGVSMGTLDFTDSGARLKAEISLRVTRTGVLHGIGTWAAQRLMGDIVLSSAPPSDLPRDQWPGYFFPVANPVRVEAGDVVAIVLRTGTDGWGRIWQWKIEVRDAAGGVRSRSSQSSFAGQLFSAATLRKQALGHVPALTPHGAAARFVLDCLDGGPSTGRIEEDVHRRFSDLFPSRDEAAVFVARILDKYAR